MPHRRYQLQLFARGVVSTTGTVTQTFASSEIANVPSIGGQVIRAADGVTESVPWSVDIVDNNSTMTSLLVDASSGRYHLLGRLVRIRHSLNSTASTSYSSLAVGRVTDVSLNPDIATYRLTIGDERWVERNTDCFVHANTSMLIPRGITIKTPYGGPHPPGRWVVVFKSGNIVVVRFLPDTQTWMPRNPAIADFLRDDLKASGTSLQTSVTSGNFSTLRWKNTASGTEYEVFTFDMAETADIVPNGFLSSYTANVGALLTKQWFDVAVVWPTSQPTVGDTLYGYLYAPTHAPTDVLPLHIPYQHPFTLAQNILTGTYSSTGIPLPRIATTAFTALQASADYAGVAFRLTQSYTMAEFLDQFIYPSYAVAPVYDSSGRISPRSLLAPTSSIGVATLPSITSTNALTHPTWSHPGREWVNVVRAQQEHTRDLVWYVPNLFGSGDVATGVRPEDEGQAAADFRATAQPLATTFTHDNLTTVGRYVKDRHYGLLRPSAADSTGGLNSGKTRAPATLLQGFTQLVFQRFGDGPAYSDVECTSAVAVLPGAFLKMGIASMPAGGSRGSTRVYQVMARLPTARGFQYSLLDLGGAAALTAPTVTMALTTGSSRHGVTWTIASVPAGAKWVLESGKGATTASTAPIAWQPLASNTTATLTRSAQDLPSRSKIFGRVYAVRPGRLRSPYSATTSKVTAKITGPTTATVTAITAGAGLLKWTNGSTGYRTEIMLDASSTASLGSSRRIAVVSPGQARYELWGLNTGDGHIAGVRHADAFGGTSTMETVTFTTTTAYTVAPNVNGIDIVWGDE